MTAQEIALVTGGNRGLGRAEVLALAARGVDVVLTYRTGEVEARAVVEEVEATGRTAVALRLDAGRTEDFEQFVDTVRTALRSIWGRTTFDVLVNNAGNASSAAFARTTEVEFDRLVDIHFKGVFFLTQKLLPLIADGGNIVNCSTGLTRFVGFDSAAYAAVKGAVEVLTKYQAKELGARGIRVNVVAPGPMATGFGGGVMRSEEFRAAMASQTALGRIGEAEDVGSAVASLTSAANGWITAQRIEVSGGTIL